MSEGLGFEGEKGERRTGVEGNRDFRLDFVCVGSGREGYCGSCTLRKARLRGRLDAFEGGLTSEGTHKPQ